MENNITKAAAHFHQILGDAASEQINWDGISQSMMVVCLLWYNVMPIGK